MNIKYIYATVLLLMLGSCGGGGGGSPVGDNNNMTDSGRCDLPYYQSIIGTYRGTIRYQVLDPDNVELSNCNWDTSISISGTSLTTMCFLNMQLNASPTQLLVPASDDPTVYQCIGDDNRNYRLSEPNSSANEQLLSEVGFPIFLGQSGHQLDPASGPYFGDNSVDAQYVYLFAGVNGGVFSQLLVSDQGYMDLIRNGPDFLTYNLISRLNKVPSQ